MTDNDPERDPFDPALMTPDERAREVAAILARGYLRLRAFGAPGSVRSPENSLAQARDQPPSCAPGERP